MSYSYLNLPEWGGKEGYNSHDDFDNSHLEWYSMQYYDTKYGNCGLSVSEKLDILIAQKIKEKNGRLNYSNNYKSSYIICDLSNAFEIEPNESVSSYSENINVIRNSQWLKEQFCSVKFEKYGANQLKLRLSDSILDSAFIYVDADSTADYGAYHLYFDNGAAEITLDELLPVISQVFIFDPNTNTYNSYTIENFSDELSDGTSISSLMSVSVSAKYRDAVRLISESNSYQYEDYHSVAEPFTAFVTDKDIVDGLKFTQFVPYDSGIDLTSLSAFFENDGDYIPLDTVYGSGEDNCAYISFPYYADGKYILMAKESNASKQLTALTNLTISAIESPYEKDITVDFHDENDIGAVAVYNLYFSKEEIIDVNAENVYCTQIAVGNNPATLYLDVDYDDYYFAIEAVGFDGSRSELSESVQFEVAPQDSDGDGVPDYWVNQYNLTAEESCSIADSDADNDGLNNLLEYQLGSNPVNPDTDGDNVFDGVEYTRRGAYNLLEQMSNGVTNDYVSMYGEPDVSIIDVMPYAKGDQVICTLSNKTEGKAMHTSVYMYIDDVLVDGWTINIDGNTSPTFSFPTEYLRDVENNLRIVVDEEKRTHDIDYSNNVYTFEPISSLTFDNTEVTIIKGQSKQLRLITTPGNSNPVVSWACSGTSGISIDQTGKIKTSKIGKAVVTATTVDGFEAVCNVTVVAWDGADYSDFDSILINNGTEVAITGYIGNDTNIEIPEMIGGLPVTTINASAFDNMNIESVYIPASITKITDSAFKRLANLREFIVAEENDQYISDEGVLFSKDHSTLVKYPAAKVGAEYAIGESTQTVCGYAFYGTALENITIGCSVRTIGNSAFENSDSFSTIVVPENVSTIGSLAFANCDGLQEVIYNAASASTSGTVFTVLLGNSTVFANSPVIKLSIGNNVKQIPSYIFARMNQLKSVDFSGNNMLSSIGSYSFYMNSKIESIILPDSVTAINSYAFYGCSSVNTVSLSNSLNTIGNYAFNNCSSVYSIDLPDTVTDIGTYAFSGCNSLESVAIPAKVRIIKANTFNNCVNLASVKFKSGNEYEVYKLEAENVHIVSGNPNWSNSSASGGHAVDYANNIDFDINVNTAGSFLITEFAFCHDRNFKLYVDNTLYGTYTGPGYDLRKNAFVTLALSEGKHNICFKNNSGYPPIYDYFYIEPLGNATAEVQGSEIIKFDGVNSVDANAFSGCSNLTDVYYPGTVSQWKQTMIASGNAPLNSATLHTEAKLVNSTTWKGHSYQLYLNTVTWKEAKGISESLNGHLVTITSAEEQAVIENLIGQFKEDNCIWLGAENESSGSYSWVTGEEWGYSNWEDGEPGGGEEHYLATCYGTEWNDFRNNSSTLTGFIVEFEPSCYSSEIVNHTWDDGVITKKVTCTEEGIITYTCVICEETNTETITALDHNYSAWTKIDDNQHQRICENDSSHVEKENHSWDNGTVTKAATCTKAGIRTFACTVCGAKKTESIKATGHNYSAWTIVKAPTCTAEGVEQRVCSNDNKHVETRTIAKSAHADNDGDGYCDNCHTNLDSGGETHESNCVCGKHHTGPFAGIIKFFHRIVYFFKNLFGKN